MRVKIPQPRRQRLVEWWFRNEREVLLWGGFVLATVLAFAFVLRGSIFAALSRN